MQPHSISCAATYRRAGEVRGAGRAAGARLRAGALSLAGATVLAGASFLSSPAPASAQDLGSRVAGASPGATVRFHFDGKPGVCGSGENIAIRRQGETTMIRGRSYRTEDGAYVRDAWECVEGPVRVELTRDGRTIDGARVTVAEGTARAPADAGGGAEGRAQGRDGREVQVQGAQGREGQVQGAQGRGGTDGPAPVVDLGHVSAAEAVAFLLAKNTLRSAPSRAADRLVFAATLAAAESWPDLLRVGRARELPDGARKNAIFWLAQVAGEKATEGLTSVIGDDSDEIEIRKHAIFALSQIEGDGAVDALIDVVRTSREPEVRKQAIFWLGQTRSPRVLAFFEEILRG
jgi:hypothetical protein